MPNSLMLPLQAKKVSQVFERNKSFDLVLRFNDENRGKIENIRNVLIDTNINPNQQSKIQNSTSKIPLHYIADIVSTTAPTPLTGKMYNGKLWFQPMWPDVI